LDTSVDRAEFVRQLYNLRHALESDNKAGDTMAEIQHLQYTIDQHDRPEKYSMKSFYSKDSRGTNNSQGSPSTDVSDSGAGATDCVELRAHGYKVKPEPGEIVDKGGKYVLKPLSKVWQLLSTYTPR
jgi:hypothetical protein